MLEEKDEVHILEDSIIRRSVDWKDDNWGSKGSKQRHSGWKQAFSGAFPGGALPLGAVVGSWVRFSDNFTAKVSRNQGAAVSKLFRLVVILLCLIGHLCWAQQVDSRTILITNVRLVDPNDQVEEHTVNVLIKNRRLKLVTIDEVSAEEGMLTLNASGNFLLGDLELGEPASFIILDQNPTMNFRILLDTKAHTLFAIDQGQVLRNTLAEAKPGPEIAAKKGHGWFAYHPPPRSLPISYRNKAKWNQWTTRVISGTIMGAFALDRQYWLTQDQTSIQQVGSLEKFDVGAIRAFRYGAVGTLNFEVPWIYTFFLANETFDRGFDSLKDDSLRLFDLRLDIPLSSNVSIGIGKMKEPISMERLASMIYLSMQERSSISDGLLPARNVGVILSGTGSGKRMTWAGGVFNDWFDKGLPFNESSSQLIGRATYLPVISQDEFHVLHLGLGVRYSNGREALQYSAKPEFTQAPIYVDTGSIMARNVVTYVPEVSWRVGPLWLAGEAAVTDVNSPESGNPVFHGYHVSGVFSITGEVRPYNFRSGVFGPLPVANPVTTAGWGAWEASLRWSKLDLTEGKVQGGELGIFSAGLNWWPAPWVSANVNYRLIFLDQLGVTGISSGLLTRLAFSLE
jgi:phosphate-selective porin OprO/OprP